MPHGFRHPSIPMKIIAFIPAYNEEKTIVDVIKGAMNYVDEIIVVDDGSTDDTANKAKGAGAFVQSNPRNLGVGATFKNGINLAIGHGADALVTLDGDNQFHVEDIPRILEPILKGKADLVTGTRFSKEGIGQEMGRTKAFGNRFFSKLISRLTGFEFTDTQCGFRAYSKEALLRLNLYGRFTYTQEVFLNLVNKNLTVTEIPIKVKPREVGKSRVVKNPFHYGLRAMKIIVLAERDHYPLKFFGIISAVFFSMAGISLLTVMVNWFITKQTSPYSNLITIGGFLAMLGVVLLVVALFADMLGRQRQLQEEVLYHFRNSNYKK